MPTGASGHHIVKADRDRPGHHRLRLRRIKAGALRRGGSSETDVDATELAGARILHCYGESHMAGQRSTDSCLGDARDLHADIRPLHRDANSQCPRRNARPLRLHLTRGTSQDGQRRAVAPHVDVNAAGRIACCGGESRHCALWTRAQRAPPRTAAPPTVVRRSDGWLCVLIRLSSQRSCQLPPQGQPGTPLPLAPSCSLPCGAIATRDTQRRRLQWSTQPADPRPLCHGPAVAVLWSRTPPNPVSSLAADECLWRLPLSAGRPRHAAGPVPPGLV